jgi:hypothetical protein
VCVCVCVCPSPSLIYKYICMYSKIPLIWSLYNFYRNFLCIYMCMYNVSIYFIYTERWLLLKIRINTNTIPTFCRPRNILKFTYSHQFILKYYKLFLLSRRTIFANIYIFIYMFYNLEFSQEYELFKICCICILIHFPSSRLFTLIFVLILFSTLLDLQSDHFQNVPSPKFYMNSSALSFLATYQDHHNLLEFTVVMRLYECPSYITS